MAMTGRKLLILLALGVMVGTFAGMATADAQGMDTYGPWDRSLSAEQEYTVGQSQGVSREPMETGAVPEQSESWFERNLQSSNPGSEVTPEDFGGQAYRRGIDSP